MSLSDVRIFKYAVPAFNAASSPEEGSKTDPSAPTKALGPLDV